MGASFEGRGEGEQGRGEISVKNPRGIARDYREFQSRFRSRFDRKRPRNERSLRRPLPLPSSSQHALSLSLFPSVSTGLVREPSHSQKTQNADGHVSRSHQSATRKGSGDKRERGRERGCVRVCVPWRQAALHPLYFRRSPLHSSPRRDRRRVEVLDTVSAIFF